MEFSGAGGQGEQPFGLFLAKKILPVVMLGYRRPFVIIQSSPAQTAIIQGKAEGLYQVELGTRIGA